MYTVIYWYTIIHLFGECSCGVQSCDVSVYHNMIYLVKKETQHYLSLSVFCCVCIFEFPVRKKRRLLSHVMTREFKWYLFLRPLNLICKIIKRLQHSNEGLRLIRISSADNKRACLLAYIATFCLFFNFWNFLYCWQSLPDQNNVKQISSQLAYYFHKLLHILK